MERLWRHPLNPYYKTKSLQRSSPRINNYKIKRPEHTWLQLNKWKYRNRYLQHVPDDEKNAHKIMYGQLIKELDKPISSTTPEELLELTKKITFFENKYLDPNNINLVDLLGKKLQMIRRDTNNTQLHNVATNILTKLSSKRKEYMAKLASARGKNIKALFYGSRKKSYKKKSLKKKSRKSYKKKSI